MREEVSKKFGDDFLLDHEVNQLESSIMEIIKSKKNNKQNEDFLFKKCFHLFLFSDEALSTYLPKNTTPARAWTLAKVSLRSLKRDLRRKQGMR